jgi:hypothetical protein
MNYLGDFVTGGQFSWTDNQTAMTQGGERITKRVAHYFDNFAGQGIPPRSRVLLAPVPSRIVRFATGE